MNWFKKQYVKMVDFFFSPNQPEKQENKKLTAEELLQISIDNGILIKTYNEQHRGLGKSTALLNKAHDVGATVVVVYRQQQKLMQERAGELGLDVDVVYFANPDLCRGYKAVNGSYLIEEGITESTIRALQDGKNKILGGFCRN